MSQIDKLKNVTGSTRLLGVLGWPVEHTLSPLMHNAAAAALGLDLLYLPLAVRPENLPAAIQGLSALGFIGANLTIPHKEPAVELVNELSDSAAAIGAVNTIVIKGMSAGMSSGSVLAGHNTDWSGFLSDLRAAGLEPKGLDCLVLGAGGAARAVSYALMSERARVVVAARRFSQAAGLASALEKTLDRGQIVAIEWSNIADASRDLTPSLVVNATPVGMAPQVDQSPWPKGTPFPPGSFIYDLIYQPAETRLMAEARKAGLPAANGLGMLLQQGALSFELWTGQKPDERVMAGALDGVYNHWTNP